MPALAATTDLHHKLSQSDGVCASDLDANELAHLVMLLRMAPRTLEITADREGHGDFIGGWICAVEGHEDWHLTVGPAELVQWWRVRIKPK